MSNKTQNLIWTKQALILCVWVAIWGLIVEIFEVSSDFLPNPVEVLERIVTLSYEPIGAGTLVTHAAASVTRLLSGFLSAMLLGVPLGLLMAYFRPINWAVTPIFELFRYVPQLLGRRSRYFGSAQETLLRRTSFLPLHSHRY